MTTELAMELLPCPFCGKPTKLRDHGEIPGFEYRYGTTIDHDSDCPLSAWDGYLYATEAEAITAWNQRTPSPSPDAEGARAARLLDALAGDCDAGEDNDWEAHEWRDAADLLRRAATLLRTPSPEASRDAVLEDAAKKCDKRWSDALLCSAAREAMEARRCADAIRALKSSPVTTGGGEPCDEAKVVSVAVALRKTRPLNLTDATDLARAAIAALRTPAISEEAVATWIGEIAPSCTNPLPQMVEARRTAMFRLWKRIKEVNSTPPVTKPDEKGVANELDRAADRLSRSTIAPNPMIRDVIATLRAGRDALRASPGIREAVLEEAAKVNPQTSETFSYQADGYATGWYAAVKAMRVAIRALKTTGKDSGGATDAIS